MIQVNPVPLIILFVIWLTVAVAVHFRLFAYFVRTKQARSLFDFKVWKDDDGVLLVTILWFLFPLMTWTTLTKKMLVFPRHLIDD